MERTTVVPTRTSENKILLKGVEKSRGFWKGLVIRTSSEKNKLEHVEFAHAGHSEWGANINKAGIEVYKNGTLSVANSTFRENDGPTIRAWQGSSELEVTESTFVSNKLPLHVTPDVARNIGGNNEYEKNDESYILLHEKGTADNEVNEESTWAAQGIPYRVDRALDLDAPLTIAEGTTVEFAQGKGMSISGDGKLTADAEGGEPITFTGVEKVKGYWRGLGYKNSLSKDNVLANVVVEYGGGGHEWAQGGGTDDDRGNIILRRRGSTRLEIRNSTIRGSSRYGIFADDAWDSEHNVADCSNLTFEDNEKGATYSRDEGGPIPACE